MHIQTTFFVLLLAATVKPAPIEDTRINGLPSKRAPQTQENAAWALARISQRARLTTMGDDWTLDDIYPARAGIQIWSFPYDDTWGDGVVVYIVDSGVRDTHQELVGRVESGYVISRVSLANSKATDDVCDHGTGVASFVAGNTVGIARKATIVPVRIAGGGADCRRVISTTDDVTEGVNWAVHDYQTRVGPKGGIINISYEFYQGDASQAAVEAAIAAGMHVTVSAGNFDRNECFGGPAPVVDQRVKDVGQIVVGNTDWDDNRFIMTDGITGSNYGSCVTLFTPGVSMNVPSNKADDDIVAGGVAQTGTSYAAPLVAGTIAALITSNGNLPPAEMKALLLQNAVNGAGIEGLNGSPDILLQSPILSNTLQ